MINYKIPKKMYTEVSAEESNMLCYNTPLNYNVEYWNPSGLQARVAVPKSVETVQQPYLTFTSRPVEKEVPKNVAKTGRPCKSP